MSNYEFFLIIVALVLINGCFVRFFIGFMRKHGSIWAGLKKLSRNIVDILFGLG